MWFCKCDCGSVAVISTNNLIQQTVSCGCVSRGPKIDDTVRAVCPGCGEKFDIELNGQKLYAENKKVLSQHTTAPEIIIKGVSRSGSTVSIYWKAENCKSYEVQYSNDKSFSNARTVTTTKNNIIMKNMSNPCYVRVKCVTNDSKIIGYWSQAQKV